MSESEIRVQLSEDEPHAFRGLGALIERGLMVKKFALFAVMCLIVGLAGTAYYQFQRAERFGAALSVASDLHFYFQQKAEMNGLTEDCRDKSKPPGQQTRIVWKGDCVNGLWSPVETREYFDSLLPAGAPRLGE